MSFSISNNETTLFVEADNKLNNPLTSDIDVNNLNMTNIEFMEFNLQASPGASPAGTLTLYSNNDETFHVVNSGGTDTGLGSSYDQSLNTTDSVSFEEITTLDALAPAIEFYRSGAKQWSMVYTGAGDEFSIRNSIDTSIMRITSSLNIVIPNNIITSKIVGSVITNGGGFGTEFNIGPTIANIINIGRPGVTTTLTGKTSTNNSAVVNIGSDTTLTDNKSISLLLESSGAVGLGRLVKLIDSAGPKVTQVLAADDFYTPIVGVCIEAVGGAQDIKIAIEGIFTVLIDAEDVISPGDPLKKSAVVDGSAALGIEGTDRIFARALTGAGLGTILAIFTKPAQT